MNSILFFQVTSRDGKKVECFLDTYCAHWDARVEVDGKDYTHGTPHVIDARTKKARKMPAEAYVAIGAILFRELDGKSVLAAYEAAIAIAEAKAAAQAATAEPSGSTLI